MGQLAFLGSRDLALAFGFGLGLSARLLGLLLFDGDVGFRWLRWRDDGSYVWGGPVPPSTGPLAEVRVVTPDGTVTCTARLT